MVDFNMVEHQANKTRHSVTMIPLQERILFDAMKLALQVTYNPQSNGSPRFSWDNNRPGEHRILAWLGRLYLFQAIPGNSDMTLLLYEIWSAATKSDHLLVLASIQLEK